MADRLSAEQVQEQLKGSPFSEFLGLQVISVDHEKEEIVMKMPMRPELERQAGTGQWHGGPIAAFIDTVGDYALVINIGGGVPTINYRVDYLRPGFNTDLTGTARVRRAGRTVGVVDIDITNDEGKLVAVGRGCYGTSVG